MFAWFNSVLNFQHVSIISVIDNRSIKDHTKTIRSRQDEISGIEVADIV